MKDFIDDNDSFKIYEFLNYPEAFWEYIKPKITVIDINHPEAKEYYCVLVKADEQNVLKDLKPIIPYVTDLKTACIAVHELKHAYDLYKLLNHQISDSNDEFENGIRDFEQQYLDFFKRKEEELCKKLSI